MQDKIMGLLAPLDYVLASREEKEKIVNQCGPDGFLNRIVPNYLFGLDVSEACNIHDWEFAWARNSKEFKEADWTFKRNLEHLIKAKTQDSFLRFIRLALAKVYYLAVRSYSISKEPL